MRVYGWKSSDYSVTLLDTHTHDGNTWTVDGQTFSATTKTGRLVTISGANQAALNTSLRTAIADVQPGDTILVRAGTYTEKYDPNTWNSYQFVLNAADSGTSTQRVHITAYPGETVTFDNSGASAGNFYAGRLDVAERCDYWDVSALNLTGFVDNIYGGGVTSDDVHPESGGRFWRVVGCTAHRTWNDEPQANVGQFEWEGDGWTILGCTFTCPTTGYFNQAHAIYVDNGSDDFEIGYCRFVNRREGFVIMTHQDGTPMLYANGWIHHCYANPQTANICRGFATSNVDNASDLRIEDCWFDGCGDSAGGFGPITVNRGLCYARRNKITNAPFPITLSNNYTGTCTLYLGTGVNTNTWDGTPFDRNTSPTSTYFVFDTSRSIANVVNE